jgi:hypothetical protein
MLNVEKMIALQLVQRKLEVHIICVHGTLLINKFVESIKLCCAYNWMLR